MSENLKNSGSFKEAICIDATKIFDSCSDKDCLEDLVVTFASAEDAAIVFDASFVKCKCVEVLSSVFAIDPVPFNNGFYAIDITYTFAVHVEAYASATDVPVTVIGTTNFTKKVILYGSDGHTKTFYSNVDYEYTASDCCCRCASTMPIASVTVVEPIVLDCNRVTAPDGTQSFLVTIGVFSIVKLVRNVPVLIPSYDYCIPTKECTTSSDSPCELFDKLNFPMCEFFPKNLEDSCPCACEDVAEE